MPDPVTATLGVVGTGTSLYGANKQAKDNRRTQDTNQAAAAEAERQDWARYLMSRGINPGGNVQTGVMPQGGQAINTRLPLWFNVNRTPGGAAPPTINPTGIPAAHSGPVVRRRAGV